MNINNFEKYIDKRVLDRGYDYYNDGNIVKVYKQLENEYVFDVVGNEDYEVLVKIDNNGEIVRSNCDCPYSFGPICKHEVAAYCKLVEIKNSKSELNIEKKPQIRGVLQDLSKEELINIIVEIANNDKVFKNTIIFKYSKGDEINEFDSCKNLMNSIVRKHMRRDGYISYECASEFVNDMEDLLVRIRSIYGVDENYLLALDIAFIVLAEAIEAFEYTDDSGGDIGMFIDEVIEVIEEIACESKNIDIKEREALFQKLLTESDSNIFDGWEEYSIEIIRIMAEFSDVEIFRSKLKMKLEYLVNDSNNKYGKYSREKLLIILFDIIKEYESKENEENFIKENLKFTSFRELLIDKLIKEKNYLEVVKLAMDAEQKDREYSGLALKWKKIRYEAYKELSITGEQEKLAEELLLSGEFEYYNELKRLNTEKHEVFYSNIKNKLLGHKGWSGSSMYFKLIVFENDLEEIIKVVRENPWRIEDYSDMLLGKYREEVIEIYISYIESQASRASNRSDYKGVCGIIRNFRNISDNNKVEEIKNKLSRLYKKKSAFVDELSRI